MAVTPISAALSAANIQSIAPVTQGSAAAADTANATGGVGNVVSQALDSLQGPQGAADSLAQTAAPGNLPALNNYPLAATAE